MKQVPLDSILLSLKQVPVVDVAVNNDPPEIFYSSRPASLVVFDGEPVLAPVGKTELSFAVNTNWDVFVDHATWYLLNNGVWLSAPAAAGPYTAVSRLPAAFSALPSDASFADARKHVPARAPSSAQAVPTIHVSMKPAEIIVTDGAPKLEAVPGTGLQRVTNTASALFFDAAEQQYYILLSGRWFSASGLDGPWSFATDKLPPDFAMIPTGSPAAPVLASVPGTVQAQQAVLKAQIPTTVTLKRGAPPPKVEYSGPPNFLPISGTSVLYAVNTADQVLKVGDRYYACYQGAWFVSNAPTGPWVLADSVPPAIRAIPPSSPMYNVTYVQIYGSTPTTVTYGYTAGYMMGFVTASVLVYGTGYYYPPVIVPGRVPIYYPVPVLLCRQRMRTILPAGYGHGAGRSMARITGLQPAAITIRRRAAGRGVRPCMAPMAAPGPGLVTIPVPEHTRMAAPCGAAEAERRMPASITRVTAFRGPPTRTSIRTDAGDRARSADRTRR